MNYSLVVAISDKTKKPYAYIDLGYRKEFIKLELVAEIVQLPVASLYSLSNEVKYTLEIK